MAKYRSEDSLQSKVETAQHCTSQIDRITQPIIQNRALDLEFAHFGAEVKAA